MYCPKCGSKLYPVDREYIEKHGMCSYCATYKGPQGNDGKENSAWGQGVAMEWYRITFKAIHRHTSRILSCEAIVASDVDGESRPVTLKCDLLSTLKEDYDLSGVEDYHDVKVEKHNRRSYFISLETIRDREEGP